MQDVLADIVEQRRLMVGMSILLVQVSSACAAILGVFDRVGSDRLLLLLLLLLLGRGALIVATAAAASSPHCRRFHVCVFELKFLLFVVFSVCCRDWRC